MDTLDILLWARRNRYPRLVLSDRPGDTISAGRDSWCAFTANMSEGERARLVARIAAWDAKRGQEVEL